MNSNSTSTTCASPYPSGSVTLAVDAPLDSQTPAQQFRSMTSIKPPISGASASGSAQYSVIQLKNIINWINQQQPGAAILLVDLRQESHGFLTIDPAFNGETEIAVGWFAERDWINVAKDLPSIQMDEGFRLVQAVDNPNLQIFQIESKWQQEDGICTATAISPPPKATSYQTEQTLAQGLSEVIYLRLPTTDHCRPRDAEVDQFVSLEAGLKSNTWLHFHCRAGDGRTTTFMVMHDIIHNATGQTGNLLSDILARQKVIGGAGLTPSTDDTVFSFPFSAERYSFLERFYTYVLVARPAQYEMKWSSYVASL